MRNPTIKERTTTAAMAMPAMAPEDKSEEDLDAIGVVCGLDVGNDEDVVASCLISGSILDSCENEDVVASCLRTRCVRDIRKVEILT